MRKHWKLSLLLTLLVGLVAGLALGQSRGLRMRTEGQWGGYALVTVVDSARGNVCYAALPTLPGGTGGAAISCVAEGKK